MVISNDDILDGPYVGNGVTDTFSHAFPANSEADIAVFVTDLAGVVTQITETAGDYTWSAVGGGGQIVLTTPLTTGFTLIIKSDRDTVQLTDFNSQGGFFPDVHEAAFDNLTILNSQINQKLTETLRAPEGETGFGALPTAIERAGGVLTFDVNGDPIVQSSGDVFDVPGITATIVADAEVAVDAAVVVAEADINTAATNAATSAVATVDAASAAGVTAVQAAETTGVTTINYLVANVDLSGDVARDWVETTTSLTPSNASSGERFGGDTALSSDGTTMVIGAYRDDAIGSNTAEGSIYRFDNVDGLWVESVTSFIPLDINDSDDFGISVDLNSDGTIMAVGSINWDVGGDSNSNEGAVYIYDWDGSAWVERTIIQGEATTERFGNSVSLSSDGSILAATLINGDVRFYDWDGSSFVKRVATIPGFNVVDLNGDGSVAIVGYGLISTYGTLSGDAAIYDWNDSAWVIRYTLTTSTISSFDSEGFSVAITDDALTAFTGARNNSNTPSGSRGVINIFSLGVSSATESSTKLIASDGGNNDYLGSPGMSCSGDGLTIAAGAESWDGAAGSSQGAVYVFENLEIINAHSITTGDLTVNGELTITNPVVFDGLFNASAVSIVMPEGWSVVRNGVGSGSYTVTMVQSATFYLVLPQVQDSNTMSAFVSGKTSTTFDITVRVHNASTFSDQLVGFTVKVLD